MIVHKTAKKKENKQRLWFQIKISLPLKESVLSLQIKVFSLGALSVGARFCCWSWVLVHIMLSHRDGALVQRKGSHYLIRLLILGTRKRCLETLGPDSKSWSGTHSALQSRGWSKGDFGTWASSKKQFTTYTVELQKCLIRVRHQTWMIPYEIATFCLP